MCKLLLKDRYCDSLSAIKAVSVYIGENESGLQSRKDKIRGIAECATPYNRPSLMDMPGSRLT